MARARANAAAIDVDQILDRPLADISAADFIRALNHPRISHTLRPIIADKKKYELWVDEGGIGRIPLKELLEKLRGEKKKAELEVPDPFGPVVLPADVLARGGYARLVEDVADAVEQRLKSAR
jgi:hypothetical protein